MRDETDRRRFLRLAGVSTVGLAGCVSGGGDGGDDGSVEPDTLPENETGSSSDDTPEEETETFYEWTDATWDTYWYSLYNMNNAFMLSGNGITFPRNEEQKEMFKNRVQAMFENAEVDMLPFKNPNPNMAPFTRGDPSFTQEPVYDTKPDDPAKGRIDASTTRWDRSSSSKVVSPSSVAWTHLKGITWAKNFENHFEILPDAMPVKFGSQMLVSVPQVGLAFSLLNGGPDGNGALTDGDSMRLVSGFDAEAGSVSDPTPRPYHHAAMVWYMSDLTSIAKGGWFGYENPEPIHPPERIQSLTDGVAEATMEMFPPQEIVDASNTRDVGMMLAAMGWYGTHPGSTELETRAKEYANGLAAVVEDNIAGNGMVENGANNQAATQGIVGQGLLWASEIDGVDNESTAENVLGYMFDVLWDEDAGTFASGEGDDTYTITARDAGDVTGGVNAADAVLGRADAQGVFARYFNQTFNHGRLQRAERKQSRDEDAEHTLPLPQDAGGQYGQSAVYNAEVEYDTESDEWTVTDDAFDTEGGMYLSNQDIWISQWGGDFYQGRGVPGESDVPQNKTE
jgi:hypothetical protein